MVFNNFFLFLVNKYGKYYDFLYGFVWWLPIGINFSKLWKSDSRPFGYEQKNLSVHLTRETSAMKRFIVQRSEISVFHL